MKISDELMWRYFELLSFRPLAEIDALKAAVAEGRNPRDVKFELGRELVDRFHGLGTGQAAQDAFVAQFQQGGLPDDMPEVALTPADATFGFVAAHCGVALLPASPSTRQLAVQSVHWLAVHAVGASDGAGVPPPSPGGPHPSPSPFCGTGLCLSVGKHCGPIFALALQVLTHWPPLLVHSAWLL